MAAALFSTETGALHAEGALRVKRMCFGNFMAFVAFESEQENIFKRALFMAITVNHLLSFRPVCFTSIMLLWKFGDGENTLEQFHYKTFSQGEMDVLVQEGQNWGTRTRRA